MPEKTGGCLGRLKKVVRAPRTPKKSWTRRRTRVLEPPSDFDPRSSCRRPPAIRPTPKTLLENKVMRPVVEGLSSPIFFSNNELLSLYITMTTTRRAHFASASAILQRTLVICVVADGRFSSGDLPVRDHVPERGQQQGDEGHTHACIYFPTHTHTRTHRTSLALPA